MAYTAIDDPSAHLKVQLYTGNATARAITFDDTDTNMQPDIVWIKARSEAEAGQFYDSLRGVQKRLFTHSTEVSETVTQGLTAFGSDGFSLGTGNGANKNNINYVAWCFKANGSGSTNNDGSTASTVSANTTSGVSLVKHTGTGSATNIGHGLGAEPKIVISKRTNDTNSWIFHSSLVAGSWTSSNYLVLNSTAAIASSTTSVDAASSSTISFDGSDDWVNASSDTYMHYIFTPKQGFSKFGTFTANNNSSGPYIHLGFRAAWVMIKRYSTSGKPWAIMDNKRIGYNVDNNVLNANAVDTEHTNDYIDICANGFKIRDNNQDVNNPDGGNYFFMAFAESPFVNSNGVPNNAR